jgi:hypothetical protein
VTLFKFLNVYRKIMKLNIYATKYVVIIQLLFAVSIILLIIFFA